MIATINVGFQTFAWKNVQNGVRCQRFLQKLKN